MSDGRKTKYLIHSENKTNSEIAHLTRHRKKIVEGTFDPSDLLYTKTSEPRQTISEIIDKLTLDTADHTLGGFR